MAKYRKKPVIIEAFQWTGDERQTEETEWIIEQIKEGNITFVNGDCLEMEIKTLEGTMRAIPNDYIIKGVKGEIYPCKPDIFEATYEPVGD